MKWNSVAKKGDCGVHNRKPKGSHYHRTNGNLALATAVFDVPNRKTPTLHLVPSSIIEADVKDHGISFNELIISIATSSTLCVLWFFFVLFLYRFARTLFLT